MVDPTRIVGAPELIEQVYLAAGIKDTKPSAVELDYVNGLMNRNGRTVTYKTLLKSISQHKETGKKADSIASVRDTATKSIKGVAAELRAERQIDEDSALLEHKEVSARYSVECDEFAMKCLKEGKFPQESLDDLKILAEADVNQRERNAVVHHLRKLMPLATENEIENQADLVSPPQISSAQKIMRNRSLSVQFNYLIAIAAGFPTKEQYLAKNIASIEKTNVLLKEARPINPTAVAEAQSVTVSESLSKNNVGKLEVPVGKGFQDKNTFIASVHSYQFNNMKPKENHIVVSTPEMNSGKPFKLFLVSHNNTFNGRSKYQPQILDRRFSKANPPGTKLIVTNARESGRTGYTTSYASALMPQFQYVNSTVSAKNIYQGFKGADTKYTVTMNWSLKAQTPKEAMASESQFSGPQELREAKPWRGYQIRVVNADGEVVGLGQPTLMNVSTNRTVSFADLKNDIVKTTSALKSANDQGRAIGHSVEVTTFECLKAMPRASISEATIDSLMTKSSLGGERSTAGGQIAAKGVVSYVSSDKYGDSATAIFIPTPDTNKVGSHAQERILTTSGVIPTLADGIGVKRSTGDASTANNLDSPKLS